jgi:ATP-dependent protease ClpP protease subunit
MKLCRAGIVAVTTAALSYAVIASADTFTDRRTGEVLHGYITGTTAGGGLKVVTEEKGPAELGAGRYSVQRDSRGRKNRAVIITINDEIMLQSEGEAFAKALERACGEGSLAVIVEIDTPGGRADVARDMCAAIQRATCEVTAYIKGGGTHGGAISAGAMLAMACDRIYMADNSVIGAATPIGIRNGMPTDMKRLYGEDVAAKFSSAMQGYMASLAEKHGRSGLIARAMVSRDVGVVEVMRDGRRMFVRPQDANGLDVRVKVWSDGRTPVTLTGREAVQCGMADGSAADRDELLGILGLRDAEIVEDRAVEKAGEDFRRVKERADQLNRDLYAKFEQLEHARTRAAGMRLIREIKTEMGQLAAIARANPDLNLDVEAIQDEYARVEAFYKQAVRN